MAGNEASEKLSWPWRKRGTTRRKGGRRRKTITSHSDGHARRGVGFISRGPAGYGWADSAERLVCGGGGGPTPSTHCLKCWTETRPAWRAPSREISLITRRSPFPSQNVLNLKFRATHVTLPVIPGDRAPTDRQCLNSSRGERTSFTMSHGNDKKCSCGCSSLYSVLVTVPADGEDGTVHEVR